MNALWEFSSILFQNPNGSLKNFPVWKVFTGKWKDCWERLRHYHLVIVVVAKMFRWWEKCSFDGSVIFSILQVVHVLRLGRRRRRNTRMTTWRSWRNGPVEVVLSHLHSPFFLLRHHLVEGGGACYSLWWSSRDEAFFRLSSRFFFLRLVLVFNPMKAKSISHSCTDHCCFFYHYHFCFPI